VLDEPYRWLQAVENRIQYIEKRLRPASPVVGLPYEHGAFLFTVSPSGQRKLFEVYDGLALGALGHPADVERLRMMAINVAHTEGFVRSAQDVTLQRLLTFGIAPQVKSAFDEVFRSPFIAKLLMVELLPTDHASQFFTLSFDGNFGSRTEYGIAAGTPQAEELMERTIRDALPPPTSLADAVRCAARAWAVGYFVVTKTPEYEQLPMPSEADIRTTLAEVREGHTFEAAVLDKTLVGRSKYRTLSLEELAPIDEVLEADDPPADEAS